jgi:transmembrane sensor
MIDPDEEALQTAAGWVAQMKGGAQTPADSRRLRAWLQQDPRHAAALELALDAWDDAGAARESSMVRREAPTRRAPPAKPRPARNSWLWASLGGGLAAGLAAAVVIAVQVAAPAQQTYATARGALRTITLADHSVLTLNTDSRVTVAYTPLRRSLTLVRGEAEFRVAHSTLRPFLVSTPTAVVRATGTDFSVRYEGRVSRVVLVEGHVRIRAPDGGRSMDLEPGYALTAPAGGAFQIAKTDAQSDLAWTSGQLIFNDRPLKDVMEEFARYSPVEVRFASPAAGEVKVSGAFRAADIRSFLRDVQTLYPVKTYTDDKGRVVLSLRR